MRRDRPQEWRHALVHAMAPVIRPNAGVVLWRWRYEAGVVQLPVAAFVVDRWIGVAVTMSALLVAVLAVVASTGVRQRVLARIRCVAVQHRIRVACVESGLYSTQGRLPFILRTSPLAGGERVLLWLPAGVTTADVTAARDRIAATCWAREVQVHPHERYGQVVGLVVCRDEPDEGG